MDKHGSHQKLALLAGTLIGAAGVALAQQAPPNDAAKMSIFKGAVAQYSLTPGGEVDGLILADGTEVFWPPHFSTQLVFSIRPGDAVTIQGSKVGVTPMVAAESVTNDATSVTVANMGPPSPPKRLEDEGRIKAQLHDRRGTLNGVLLEDGTIVRVPPPEAERLAANLAVGQPLYASGDGVASPLGKVIAAHEIGPEKMHLSKISDSLFERWKQDIFGGRGDDVPPPPPSPKK
ncbi:hypothetical protein RZS28_19615 (plasmid) [Methylocapsa polymorpha]|uniref:Uncharacterized protein n=1 Tax=Methylocapsa polymorpha TaxID=3080828 RepID=A0ABZ0HXJ6_9HYPH|nr:hypothetical protein RZS28_19615 [Methylocapsa sp. RX1]